VSEPEDARGRTESVTPLELFFDLVFVFAITQVTSLVASDPTWGGLGRGVLVLAALWWAWTAFAWLTNAIDPEAGSPRAMLFVAMAAVLVASLAVPEAFGDHALEFGLAYLVVRVVHLFVYARATGDRDIAAAIKGFAPGMLTACGLLIAASAFDGAAQAAFWLAALLLDYGTPLLTRPTGFRVAAGHFAERHGLIVIIALGEAIVAIGVGTGFTLSGEAIVAAVLGLAVVAAMWWAYFDVVAPVAARKLAEMQGVTRQHMARDSYSYLHLPMILGIELVAVGIKKTLDNVDEPLAGAVAFMLCGGVTLYLLGLVAFRLRNVRTLNRQRLVTAGVCLALIPVGTSADAIVLVACLAAACTTLIAYEALRFREARARVRAAR
jgi:low temperature requirement protein LtrA